MDVTDEEAATTPDTTTLFPNSRSVADSSLQVQAPSSMLLMDPARETKQNYLMFSFFNVSWNLSLKHQSGGSF